MTPTTPKPRFTDDQIKVIVAIIDTYIPELTGKELDDFVSEYSNGTNDEDLVAFAKAGIVNQKVADIVVEKLHSLPSEKIEDLGMVFKVLSSK